MTERHIIFYLVYIKEVLQQLPLFLFPFKTSALMQNEKRMHQFSYEEIPSATKEVAIVKQKEK